MYFKHKEDPFPTGTFNFEIISKVYIVCNASDSDIELHIEGLKRVFRFHVDNVKERDTWAEVIVSSILIHTLTHYISPIQFPGCFLIKYF
jgi:hypothetical protein